MEWILDRKNKIIFFFCGKAHSHTILKAPLGPNNLTRNRKYAAQLFPCAGTPWKFAIMPWNSRKIDLFDATIILWYSHAAEEQSSSTWTFHCSTCCYVGAHYFICSSQKTFNPNSNYHTVQTFKVLHPSSICFNLFIQHCRISILQLHMFHTYAFSNILHLVPEHLIVFSGSFN